MMSFTEYLDSPMHWMRRAWLATQKAISESFAEYNLSNAQFEVLGQLWTEDGLEQRVIQERLCVTSATLTGVVDGLVERGFVERRMSAEDARVKRLYLCEAGRILEQALGEKAGELHQMMLHGLSPAEITILKEWMKHITANFEQSPDTR